jgi:hypothetical protein
MGFVSIPRAFDVVDADMYFYIVDQTFKCLTLT